MGQQISSIASLLLREPQYVDERSIKTAASIIADADILLVATGAGMSADSGLAIFADAAKAHAYKKQNLTYRDLAEPHWIQDDPELFYGFVCNMFNEYRDKEPHEGYRIIKKWRDEYFGPSNSTTAAFQKLWSAVEIPEMKTADKYESGLEHSKEPAGPFFIYTSNVDSHHQKAGFLPSEVYEIHGCVEEWQCSKPCSNELWTFPIKDLRFKVDQETLRAPKELLEFIEDPDVEPYHIHNHPLCKNCGAPARPRACFFKDLTWHYPSHAHARYLQWIAVIKRIAAENRKLKVVILEIGCGILVNSVRMQTRHLRENALKGIYCHTIRINPDFPNVDDFTVSPEQITGIRGKALEVITALDDELTKIKS